MLTVQATNTMHLMLISDVIYSWLMTLILIA